MLKQPGSVVKLTNVAVIRYRLSNRSFQIACYRNTAINYRNGIDTPIQQVVQSQQIFESVGHGSVAKSSDLKKYFPHKTKKEIIEIILQRGQLQVSDKQRQAQSNQLFNDISTLVHQKCVHPQSKRQFPLQSIREAIKQIHFPIKNDQSAKAQSLHCIKALSKKFKIARAKMLIKVTGKIQQITKLVKKANLQIQKDRYEAQCQIQPNQYRDINQYVKQLEGVKVDVLINAMINKSPIGLKQKPPLLQPIQGWKQEYPVAQQVQQKQHKKPKYYCKTCNQKQGDPSQFRQHHKSERHKFNLQRINDGLKVLQEMEYQALIIQSNMKI